MAELPGLADLQKSQITHANARNVMAPPARKPSKLMRNILTSAADPILAMACKPPIPAEVLARELYPTKKKRRRR